MGLAVLTSKCISLKEKEMCEQRQDAIDGGASTLPPYEHVCVSNKASTFA